MIGGYWKSFTLASASLRVLQPFWGSVNEKNAEQYAVLPETSLIWEWFGRSETEQSLENIVLGLRAAQGTGSAKQQSKGSIWIYR